MTKFWVNNWGWWEMTTQYFSGGDLSEGFIVVSMKWVNA